MFGLNWSAFERTADVWLCSCSHHSLQDGRTIFVDCTSGEPEATREIAEKLKAAGVGFVDAPVSGGPKGFVRCWKGVWVLV